MKNLTDTLVTLIRQDSTRIHLPPSPTPPTVVVEGTCHLGFLDGVSVIRERRLTVDFHGMVLDPADQPYIVSREVFDALPADRVEFITPDFDSAIANAFKIPHAIRQFVAKAGVPTPQANCDIVHN